MHMYYIKIKGNCCHMYVTFSVGKPLDLVTKTIGFGCEAVL